MSTKIYLWGMIILIAVLGCNKSNRENEYTSLTEGRVIQVPALTGGKILRLYIDTGDVVQTGDTLAIVDTTELGYQNEQLQGKLMELKIKMEMARTGLQRAKSDLDYIQKKSARVTALYKNNSVPKQTLDDITNQLERARTVAKTAWQNVQSLTALEKQLDAQVKIVRKKIRDAVILSPADGTITSKYFEMGEAIAPFSPIVELINLQSVDVKIYIAEKRLPEVKINQKVAVHVDGFSQTLTGRVSWISPKAEFTPKSILTPETRNSLVYAVKVTIANPEGILKHGMPVEVEL